MTLRSGSLFLGPFFLFALLCFADAKAEHWPPAKSAGYFVSTLEMCDKFVGENPGPEIQQLASKLVARFRGDGGYETGYNMNSSVVGADICGTCASFCLGDEWKKFIETIESRFGSLSK